MFTLGFGLLGEYSKKEERAVLVVGLDGAGKTTYADSFKACFDKTHIRRDSSKFFSTIGLNLVKVDCGHVILNLWDVGGHKDIRSLWLNYIDEANVIIFVIDGSNESRLDEALKALGNLLKQDSIGRKPFLVLLNKCEEKKESSNDDAECFVQENSRPETWNENSIFEKGREDSSSNDDTSVEANNTNHFDESPSTSIILSNAWPNSIKSARERTSQTSRPTETRAFRSFTERAERIRLCVYALLNEVDLVGDNVAIISASALENLNVHKSAIWVLNAILYNGQGKEKIIKAS